MNQDIQTSHAVVAEGLGKRYGEQWALRDFDLAVSAMYWIGNTVDGPSPKAVIEACRRCREDIEQIGAPHRAVSEICSKEAEALLRLGDWRTCLDRLRVALGARPSALADARARNTAALLASPRGRHAQAAGAFRRLGRR